MVFSYKASKEKNVNSYVLEGELIDRGQALPLLTEIEEAVSKNENKILLNLQNLKYINSSGLNILINILTKARKSGGEVAICCVNKKVNELLVITKLNDVFNVSSSPEEAFKVLSK